MEKKGRCSKIYKILNTSPLENSKYKCIYSLAEREVDHKSLAYWPIFLCLVRNYTRKHLRGKNRGVPFFAVIL